MRDRLPTLITVACAAMLAAGGMVLAAPASAESTGTAKVRTQRMSEPNLNSPQDGWYNEGDQLALVCSTHGQAVQGFFSFNIPGGWDDLWYKVSDGHYVADVDIETGTLNSVAPDCTGGPPQEQAPPAQASAREDRAVDWATSAVGSDAYNFLCGRFVANAYGKANLGVASAQILHDQLAGAGQIHSDMNYPKGALVFSSSKWDLYNGVHQGHVMIARGDGTFVSGGVDPNYGTHHTVQILNSWNPSPGATYLGWAYAPADWPGP